MQQTSYDTVVAWLTLKQSVRLHGLLIKGVDSKNSCSFYTSVAYHIDYMVKKVQCRVGEIAVKNSITLKF